MCWRTGDSQALPGYVSVYLQVTDPKTSSGKWDCFASYRLCIANQADEKKAVSRDSWHRFSAKRKSHGWCVEFMTALLTVGPMQHYFILSWLLAVSTKDCYPVPFLGEASVAVQQALSESIQSSYHKAFSYDFGYSRCDFAPLGQLLETRQQASPGETVLVTADILVLSENVVFSREADLASSGSPPSSSGASEVLSGKFTWRVTNFGLFREMIKSQKIMSPAFPAGECSLRLSVYQSAVGGVDYLSMCLESKDSEKSGPPERSCWCLFRMSVLSQTPGGKHLHRDSYGRFAVDSNTGDNTSLGWNDFMSMAAFLEQEQVLFICAVNLHVS